MPWRIAAPGLVTTCSHRDLEQQIIQRELDELERESICGCTSGYANAPRVLKRHPVFRSPCFGTRMRHNSPRPGTPTVRIRVGFSHRIMCQKRVLRLASRNRYRTSASETPKCAGKIGTFLALALRARMSLVAISHGLWEGGFSFRIA
jgi:hypothetical protein